MIMPRHWLNRIILALLVGEPKPTGGWGRERYIYAPVAGVFRTTLNIGDAVREGQRVAHIDDTPIAAPKTGILRGLVRDGVAVAAGAKCVEVVPAGSRVTGIAERPARVAAGVLEATLRHSVQPPLARAEVSCLLHLCFPALVARNTADLKWKRFLFLSLGEASGRSGLMPPHCDARDHFAACFAAPMLNGFVGQAPSAVGGISP